MYYKLSQNIALRSWKLVPYAYYIYGNRNAIGLKKEEWDLLYSCDGVTDMVPSSQLYSRSHSSFFNPIALRLP